MQKVQCIGPWLAVMPATAAPQVVIYRKLGETLAALLLPMYWQYLTVWPRSRLYEQYTRFYCESLSVCRSLMVPELCQPGFLDTVKPQQAHLLLLHYLKLSFPLDAS